MTKLNLIAEPDQHVIVMTREFNAPRALVFKTLTDPALVARWWGPKELVTIVDKMDARAGGVWRYVQRDPDGGEYVFRGVYHDIAAPERLVYTFEYDGEAGHVMLETVTLDERDGKTLLTDICLYQTVADRDAMIKSGMEQGTVESWDRFELLLADS